MHICDTFCRILSEEGHTDSIQTRKERVPMRWGTEEGMDISATEAIKGGKGKVTEKCVWETTVI